MSVISWTYIFQRYQIYKNTQKEVAEFDQKFWSGIDLNDYYNKILADQNSENRKSESQSQVAIKGQKAIFAAGFREFNRLHQQMQVTPDVALDGIKRAMQTAFTKQINKLEQGLPFLATVQSMSPYIGLFGTVWGIMHSFRQLSTVQQATISMVAPGISEALIATAMGLVAAIPAGIAYNRYTNKIDLISQQYEAFYEEFLSLLTRNIYAK